MKNIFDYISNGIPQEDYSVFDGELSSVLKESLLDDFDTMEKDADKLILSKWFETNCTGNYKIKTIKSLNGGIKITGNMIIKNFDGENFPGLNVVEVDGDIMIEKCPNLKTIAGLFEVNGYPLLKMKGSLFINNCPNLTELLCPQIVTGDFQLSNNKSLKSLNGAPEMVYGNVIIMKNGKKFNENQIKSVIQYCDYITCSDEEELANLNETEDVVEAMGNPYLSLLAKQLKEIGLSFKDLFGRRMMAWDDIDSTHIVKYEWRYKYPDAKDLSAARQIISGKQSGIIFLYCYDDNNKIKFMKSINDNKVVHKFAKSSYGGRGMSMRSTEIIDMICGKGYDRTDGMLIILDNGLTRDVIKKRGARMDARQGMVENNPEYYKELARENIARYKKIIATNRAKKNTGSVERVQKKVEEIIQRVLKASTNIAKDPMKYKDSLMYLSTLNDYVYSRISYDRGKVYGKDGILILFNEYMDKWSTTAAGANDYSYMNNTDIRVRLDNIEQKIDERISQMQRYLNIFNV